MAGKATRGGAPGCYSNHERDNMRDARARLAKRMAALRARRATAAGGMLLSDNQKTIRRWASTKCTPVYITHQMNAQRARLRPAYYSLATAGGANKIRSSTWVL